MSPRRDPMQEASWWRRRPAEAVVAGVVVIALLTVVALRVADGQGRSPAQTEVRQRVLEEGEALYDAACASCHGDQRQGFAQPGVPAPPLDGNAHSWHHPDDQIVGLIRRGGNAMPAVGASWSDEQIEAVLTYVKSDWEPWQRQRQPATIGE